MLLFYSYYNIYVCVLYSSSQVTFVERNPVVVGGSGGGGSGAVGSTLQVYIRVNVYFYLYTCYLLL